MRLLGQLVLAFALLAALVAARAPAPHSRRHTFSVKQVQKKVPAVPNRGFKALRKAMRKFGHADAIPKLKAKEEKRGLQKQGGKTANKAAAAQKDAAAASSDTATTDSQDTEYVCEVTVWTAKIRLNFDTGSSDL